MPDFSEFTTAYPGVTITRNGRTSYTANGHTEDGNPLSVIVYIDRPYEVGAMVAVQGASGRYSEAGKAFVSCAAAVIRDTYRNR